MAVVATRFSSLHTTFVTNRALIVAIGSFGAQALAHLWPRLRFEDFQRDLLRPGLPRLRRTVGFGLLLPMARGGFVVGAPSPERWDDDIFTRRVARLAPRRWEPDAGADAEDTLYTEELPAALLPERRRAVPGEAVTSERRAYFDAALEHRASLGNLLVQIADMVRIDEDAPGRDAARFTVYVIATLTEPAATAVLWPLVMILRRRLEPHLSLDVVALLSTGAYGPQEERQGQGAAIYAALRELRYFSHAGSAGDHFDLAPATSEWVGRPYFDHCYLLDSEKRNDTRPRDEAEIIVAIGNTIETLLISDAPDQIAAHLGPDEATLRVQGPFSTVGAASVYIPIDEWRARHQQRYILEVLQKEYLQRGETSEEEAVQADAEVLDEQMLSLDVLLRQVVAECPLSVHDETEDEDVVATLLQASRQHRPLTGGGPTRPVASVHVDPEVARPPYTEPDPTTERRRHLDPEGWLAHLYHHYRTLGLDEAHIFPGDPELPAMRAAHPDPRHTRLDAWYERMLLACNREVASALVDGSDTSALALGVDEAHGIIPTLHRALRRQVAERIREHNHGVLDARALIGELRRRMDRRIRQVADYRLRLERALDSDEMADAYERSAHLRLAFRRLLADRPHPAGLFSRGVLLATLCAGFLYYAIPSWYPNIAVEWRRYGSVSVGLALALVAGLALWGLHRWRLRRAIGRIEDELTRLLTLQVNHTVAQVLVTTADDGVLPQIATLLAAYEAAIDGALEELRDREADLERYLSEPLTLRQPFLRRPLPGLDDLEQQLQEEVRTTEQEFPLASLVKTDPEGATRYLEPLIAHDVAQNGAPPVGSVETVERYYSLGDLLLGVIERHAGRLRELVPPEDLKIEPLLRERLPAYNPNAFLTELRGRTQPMLKWDDEALAPGLPIQLELLAIEQPIHSEDVAPLAQSLKLRPVASLDPFAITCLRLVHGIRLDAVPHFEVYARDFRDVGPTRRAQLALVPAALTEVGDYFEPTRSEVADA